MPIETPIPTPDVKEITNIYASLAQEILQNLSNSAKILLLLQDRISGDKSLTETKPPEITNFIQSYGEAITSISNNLDCPSSQIRNNYLRNARRLWGVLGNHTEIMFRDITEKLSQHELNKCNPSSLDFQQRTLSFFPGDFIQTLRELQEAVAKDFHYSADSFKHMKKLAKECESNCIKLQSNYDALLTKLESLQVQREESMRALDLQTETLQSRYAELSKVFNNSILQINTRGIEDYEKTVNVSKVVQEHLKAELASAKDKKDELLPAIEKEVKDSRRKKYKLESQLETQIAAYDREMSALQEEYEQILKKYDEEKSQLEDYKSKIAALRPEHEKVLAEGVAEKEQQKALEAGDTVITEATSSIVTYDSTFPTRRAALTKSKTKGRDRR